MSAPLDAHAVAADEPQVSTLGCHWIAVASGFAFAPDVSGVQIGTVQR